MLHDACYVSIKKSIQTTKVQPALFSRNMSSMEMPANTRSAAAVWLGDVPAEKTSLASAEVTVGPGVTTNTDLPGGTERVQWMEAELQEG